MPAKAGPGSERGATVQVSPEHCACLGLLGSKILVGGSQVLTEFSDEQLPLVLEATERMEAHLTAAVVSNDPVFTQTVLLSSPLYAG
jgi:hypothetical protein